MVYTVRRVGLGLLLACAGVPMPGQANNVEITRLRMSQLEQSLNLYMVEHNRYPSTSEGLAALAEFMPSGQVPVDGWGRPFLYTSPPDAPAAGGFELVSLGRDGQPGGTGSAEDPRGWGP